MERLPVA